MFKNEKSSVTIQNLGLSNISIFANNNVLYLEKKNLAPAREAISHLDPSVQRLHMILNVLVLRESSH